MGFFRSEGLDGNLQVAEECERVELSEEDLGALQLGKCTSLKGR